MSQNEWLMLLEGAFVTLIISLISIFFGLFLGVIISFIRNIPIIKQILTFYISLIKTIPLITLVLFLFLILPILGFNFNKYIIAIIALIINTSVFNADILSGAMLSFPKEQVDVAKSLGMNNFLIFIRIILPQIFLTSLPALVNEMTFLIKASPAISIIGIVDLARATNRIYSVTYNPILPILGACCIYMIIIGVLLILQGYFKKFVYNLAI